MIYEFIKKIKYMIKYKNKIIYKYIIRNYCKEKIDINNLIYLKYRNLLKNQIKEKKFIKV